MLVFGGVGSRGVLGGCGLVMVGRGLGETWFNDLGKSGSLLELIRTVTDLVTEKFQSLAFGISDRFSDRCEKPKEQRMEEKIGH